MPSAPGIHRLPGAWPTARRRSRRRSKRSQRPTPSHRKVLWFHNSLLAHSSAATGESMREPLVTCAQRWQRTMKRDRSSRSSRPRTRWFSRHVTLPAGCCCPQNALCRSCPLTSMASDPAFSSQELEMLADGNTVYKLIGPVLVKQARLGPLWLTLSRPSCHQCAGGSAESYALPMPACLISR